MSENSTPMELAGLERFSQLEDRIYRVVEAFKTIRKDNETLKAENQKLNEEVDILKNKQSSSNDNLVQLHKEREALRERVERALSLLATLEEK